MCVWLCSGACTFIHTVLMSFCLVSDDRPSVCRCCSRRTGVSGDASKSTPGSGDGERRLSESFSMFLHQTLLHRLLLQLCLLPPLFCVQMQETTRVPALEPLISLCAILFFQICICLLFSWHGWIFISTSAPLSSPSYCYHSLAFSHLMLLKLWTCHSSNVSISSTETVVLNPPHFIPPPPCEAHPIVH